MPTPADRLRKVKTLDELVAYLQDELDWPLQDYPFDEVTFEYRPEELGLKEEDAAKVKAVHQLRPLNDGQPWGIFFVEFERKRMPVVVLRRILSHLVVKKRAASHQAREAAWDLGDLLFIAAFGEDGRTGASEREVAFAHFRQEAEGDLPTLQVLGWDGADTGLKLDYVADELRTRLCWPEDPEDTAAWREQWAGAFRHGLYHNIRTSDALAAALATLARRIRGAALTLMAHETEKGGLRQLHKAFQTALIHDLTEKNFADTYAQTVTYGLLTAAISSTDMDAGAYGTAIHAGKLADMVPLTNPFLKEMLGTFLQAGGQKGGINFDELGVQEVVELLRSDATDLPAILRDFGNKTHGEDPVIFFYEHFLAAYDRQLKVQRGSFYTPKPVVSYIVRSVHELLQSEFGLADGLADTATWGEMAARTPGLTIPEGTPPDAPFVVILDPATGTGTFLVEVIDVIHRTLMAKWQAQRLGEAQRLALWNDYVPRHLLPRLHGYELMMAPYAIAHMKIGLKLWETGYRFGGSVERVRVYLTNALEPADEGAGQLTFAGWGPALAHEAQAVNAVKRWQRFTVVVGNPPYSKLSHNKGAHIDALMERFKTSIKLEEIQRQALSNDYVKFVCLAITLLEKCPTYIFGFITDNSYLDGPLFRDMRADLLSVFPVFRLVDLGGNSRRGSSTSADENVFDIQQGVAIAIGQRNPRTMAGYATQHLRLLGTRTDKLTWLTTHDVSSTSFTNITPQGPQWRLLPTAGIDRNEWVSGISIPALFSGAVRVGRPLPFNGAALATRHDEFAIAFTQRELRENLSRFFDRYESYESLNQRFRLCQSTHFSFTRAREETTLTEAIAAVRPILYRPFDVRYVVYHRLLIGEPRPDIMRHLLQPNLALLTTRRVTGKPYDNVFVTNTLVEYKSATHDRNTQVFPLYLYPNGNDSSSQLNWNHIMDGRKANLDNDILQRCKQQYGINSADELFYFVYALLYSPQYRDRYQGELEQDYARFFLPTDKSLFQRLSSLGSQLIRLHLMESPVLDAEKDDLCVYAGPDEPVVGKVSWDDESVYLDRTGDARFCCISEAVWNFHIGGYQVCEKWLKDRKGRRLSAEEIDHYRKITVALQHTLYIMDEIDAVIEEHGGWPIR